MCAKTTVAPLDRIKILLQAHNKHYKHHGKHLQQHVVAGVVLKGLTVKLVIGVIFVQCFLSYYFASWLLGHNLTLAFTLSIFLT